MPDVERPSWPRVTVLKKLAARQGRAALSTVPLPTRTRGARSFARTLTLWGSRKVSVDRARARLWSCQRGLSGFQPGVGCGGKDTKCLKCLESVSPLSDWKPSEIWPVRHLRHLRHYLSHIRARAPAYANEYVSQVSQVSFSFYIYDFVEEFLRHLPRHLRQDGVSALLAKPLKYSGDRW